LEEVSKMKQASEVKIRVSEVINEVSSSSEGTGYLGFIVTYPDGKIENKILDYDRDSYQNTKAKIAKLRQVYLSKLKHN